jgi:hypothetical protein
MQPRGRNRVCEGENREGGLRMKVLVRVATLAALGALVLVPTAAQADPSFYETPIFGIANAPGGALYVADAGQGVVDADSGALVAPILGANDIAPIGRGEMLAVGANEDGTGLAYISRGRVALVADTAEFETSVDPAGDGDDEGSNPFDLARLNGHTTLIADAAGNSLLVADQQGRLDWVASFPEQGGIQPVPTSVAVGPDGAYYVGELTGAPFPTGISRVWRIEPGTRHAACGTSPACSVVVNGLTAVIDLQFGPDGALYVAQLDDAGVGAFEEDQGIGGSVRRCSVTTGACSVVVDGIPILTAIAFRGDVLWGASWALVPGLADVTPLVP